MSQVKFYRGDKKGFNETEHKDGIFFAVDTEEILMNGQEYGKDPDWNEIEVVLSSPLTRWYNGDTLIKEIDVVGELTDAYTETSATRVEIGTNVTSIGDYAFQDCSGLTSIIIPNSVTSIGEYAFAGCTGLTSINIPNSVTSIGYYAFYGCSGLTSITIPNSVTSIISSTFQGCSKLTSITIPDSVTSIGQFAFRDCSGLTSITIPNSVTSIGVNAFRNCSGLTSIEIPDSVTSIGQYAFQGCSGLTSIEIPDSVTSIGQYAFSACSGLTSIYCNSVNEPCSVNGATFLLNNSDIIGTLYVKKGGSVSTYPTWLNDQGNLGYSGSGRWSVVEYFD